MQKRKFCIGRVKGNFLWQPYTIWTEWRLNSLNMKWMANLLFNYVLSLLYFNVNSAVESCICTAYQKSFRKTKVGFFRFKEYYYFAIFLSYKNQNKSTIFSSGRENSNCSMLKIIHYSFFSTESQKSIIVFWLFFLTPKELYLETSLILAGQVLNAHHIIPLRLTYCEIAWPELGQPSGTVAGICKGSRYRGKF